MTKFAIGLACFLSSTIALSVTGQASFIARGNPGALTIAGKGIPVTGDAETGVYQADFSKVVTGIALRDEHTRTYLGSTGELKLKSGLKGGAFCGDLTVKGVTKEVCGVAQVSGGGVKAEFKVNVNDFNLGKASYLGVGVEPEVQVTVELKP